MEKRNVKYRNGTERKSKRESLESRSGERREESNIM